MDWLTETTALENGSPQRENRSEVYTNTHMDKCVYTCPHMYTHSVRTSVASLCVLSFTMCFSATSTVLGTSPPPRDIPHRMQAVLLPNGAPEGSCHLDAYMFQAPHQVLSTHYLIYSCNNTRIRITVTSCQMSKLRVVEGN